MKLILAVIRIAKMQETKDALSEVGLPSFTATSVLGRGHGNGDAAAANPQFADMIPEMPRLKSKRLITLVVTDDKKDLAIETLIKVNQTQKSGDGKIIVVEAMDSIRVRTGEKGDSTLD